MMAGVSSSCLVVRNFEGSAVMEGDFVRRPPTPLPPSLSPSSLACPCFIDKAEMPASLWS